MRRLLEPEACLRAGALAAPALAVLAPLALTPLLVVLALGVLAAAVARGGPWPRPPLVAFVPLAGLLLWGAPSALWSLHPSASLWLAFTLSVISLSGAILLAALAGLSPPARGRVSRAFLLGAGLGLALLAVEILANAPVLRFLSFGPEGFGGPPRSHLGLVNRGVSLFSIWVWPFALLLWRRRGWRVAAPVLLALLALALQGESATARLALLAGALAFALVRLAPVPMLRSLAILLVAVVAAAPLVARLLPPPLALAEAVPSLPNSAYHRLLIWEFTGNRIAERPLLGWGLDSARAIPGGKAEVFTDVTIPGRAAPLRGHDPLLPLHPHNGVLQLWLELGAVGAAAGALLLVLVCRALWRRAEEPTPTALGAATLAAALVVVSSSFGLWQNWWVSALWLSSLLAGAALAPGREAGPGRSSLSPQPLTD
ncbi:MAG: O-antigen ligase family protein [Proteobacteria bacterium]|nr:O-antigen ligase family protein [Pseudomonadota bacterium]